LEDFLKWQKQDKVSVTHIEVLVASERFEVCFDIYSKTNINTANALVPMIIGEKFREKGIISLWYTYSCEHYQPIINIQRNEWIATEGHGEKDTFSNPKGNKVQGEDKGKKDAEEASKEEQQEEEVIGKQRKQEKPGAVIQKCCTSTWATSSFVDTMHCTSCLGTR
jgi:hypothetical protein